MSGELRRERLRPTRWLGDSRKQVQGFPDPVKQNIGDSLYDVQRGVTPPQAKPIKGMGTGVFEIVTRFETNTYRTVYAVQIGKHVDILHAFQKKSPQGRRRANTDIALIRRRCKKALEIEKEK